eukprot:TRINITY_DN2867_c0_g1_i14.p1 TRINITY_DN2867_c0_g1~~TRINITY_DN2867_c0_g1_i14.p1  ORF type:complete len:150 (-),score=30.59 TRINITY_DN2867_c0_g1_i14:198-647(-)
MLRELTESFSLPSIDENDTDICLVLKYLPDSYTQLISQERESGNEIRRDLSIAQNDCAVLLEQLESVKQECVELREIVKRQKVVENDLLEVKIQLADEQNKSKSALAKVNELANVQVENESAFSEQNSKYLLFTCILVTSPKLINRPPS